MKFATGQSGNPSGRPQGATNKRTQLAKLIEPHAPALIQKLIALALDGDINALRFALERVLPKAANEQYITLPGYNTLSGESPSITKAILAQLADNEVTISQAKDILAIINNPRTSELYDKADYQEIRKELDKYLLEHKREF